MLALPSFFLSATNVESSTLTVNVIAVLVSVAGVINPIGDKPLGIVTALDVVCPFAIATGIVIVLESIAIYVYTPMFSSVSCSITPHAVSFSKSAAPL